MYERCGWVLHHTTHLACVAGVTHDIRFTSARPCHGVTQRRRGPARVTTTLGAVLLVHGVAIVTLHAPLALVACGAVDTFQAFAGGRVAASSHARINVAVTVAPLAVVAGHGRVSIVTVGARATSRPGVALFTRASLYSVGTQRAVGGEVVGRDGQRACTHVALTGSG